MEAQISLTEEPVSEQVSLPVDLEEEAMEVAEVEAVVKETQEQPVRTIEEIEEEATLIKPAPEEVTTPQDTTSATMPVSLPADTGGVLTVDDSVSKETGASVDIDLIPVVDVQPDESVPADTEEEVMFPHKVQEVPEEEVVVEEVGFMHGFKGRGGI